MVRRHVAIQYSKVWAIRLLKCYERIETEGISRCPLYMTMPGWTSTQNYIKVYYIVKVVHVKVNCSFERDLAKDLRREKAKPNRRKERLAVHLARGCFSTESLVLAD